LRMISCGDTSREWFEWRFEVRRSCDVLV
jgi:hypothetical protein